MLNPAEAVEQAMRLHAIHLAERERLDVIRRYYKGCQARPMVIPSAAPREVKVMARSSRVNVIPIVVNTLVQSMFVDGFRARGESEDSAVWAAWQANGMDSRQTAIHRAAFQYGASYSTVLPGDDGIPVIKGYSPRSMSALYGEDQDWPMWALARLGNGLFRLFDDEASYFISIPDQQSGRRAEFIRAAEHGAPVTPVVRFLDEEDLDVDDEVDVAESDSHDGPTPLRGQVAPLMALQDQIDLTTFGLQIAQHYSAFKQRWVIGWTASSEAELLRASASKVWTFDGDPESIKLGEFAQSDLRGFLESREASLRHAATLTQTPVHELTGQLVQMSAEALAAAEAGKDRKVNERQTVVGESHERQMWLCGRYMGIEVATDSQVVWRETSARSFAATVDGLGKLATMLQVPVEELWERIPGTTKQDVDRWREIAERNGSFGQLAELLDRQSRPNQPAAA